MIATLKDNIQLTNSSLKYLGCLFILIDHPTMILVPPTSSIFRGHFSKIAVSILILNGVFFTL